MILDKSFRENDQKGGEDKWWGEWRQALAVIFVNLDKPFPTLTKEVTSSCSHIRYPFFVLFIC
jgi:hypothetical protein